MMVTCFFKVQQFVRWRGLDTSAVSKVKGHADEGLVALGRVREIDRIGNNEADAAAALGRRRVHHSVAWARRMVTRSCARWYPIVRELHHFFIAIARSVLNDDGDVWYYFASGCLVDCCKPEEEKG